MTELATNQPSEIVAVRPPSQILRLIELGMEKGLTVEMLDKFQAMLRDEEAAWARSRWIAAMAEFKRTCPPIPRKHENAQFTTVTRNGTKQPRMYADLEDMATVADPVLSGLGLCATWANERVDEKGTMHLDCCVSHVDGHVQMTPISGPAGSKAGASELQKFGACRSYLKRDSYANALGLTTVDDASDGEEPVATTTTVATPDAPPATITPEQVTELETLIVAAERDRVKMLAFFGVERMDGLTRDQYMTAKRMIQATIDAKAARAVPKPAEAADA